MVGHVAGRYRTATNWSPHRFRRAPSIRHAIAIRIADTGMTSYKAGAPFAVNVMVGRPSMSSLGIPAMTDFSIENHVMADKGYGGTNLG